MAATTLSPWDRPDGVTASRRRGQVTTGRAGLAAVRLGRPSPGTSDAALGAPVELVKLAITGAVQIPANASMLMTRRTAVVAVPSSLEECAESCGAATASFLLRGHRARVFELATTTSMVPAARCCRVEGQIRNCPSSDDDRRTTAAGTDVCCGPYDFDVDRIVSGGSDARRAADLQRGDFWAISRFDDVEHVQAGNADLGRARSSS